MIEKILGLGTGITLTDLGALAALTTIIVEVLKKILPKKVPTQLVTLIVGLILSISTALVYFSSVLEAIGVGAVIGLVTAFASMSGFDALKSIWLRFNPIESVSKSEVTDGSEEEDIGGER
jgi:spore maturation protein SpmB